MNEGDRSKPAHQTYIKRARLSPLIGGICNDMHKSKNSNSVLSMTYGIFKKSWIFFKEKFHIDLIQVCFIGNFGKISFGNIHVHKLK